MSADARLDRDFAAARRAMIDSQLRTSGVNEPWVLARINAVPREDFVPAAMRDAAYIDRAVPLDGGGMLAAPLFYGRMLTEAKPAGSDRALVVDGGSGYLPALLEGLVQAVTVLAPSEVAAATQAGGDHTLLVVDGAAEYLPDTLAGLLADDARVVGGMVDEGVTRLAVGRKSGGAIALLPVAEMGIPRLAAFDRPKAWAF